jgi:hypothetical protein
MMELYDGNDSIWRGGGSIIGDWQCPRGCVQRLVDKSTRTGDLAFIQVNEVPSHQY